MIEAFIPDQAYLMLNHPIKPVSSYSIVAIVDNEFTVKRFINNSSGIRQMPDNPKYKPIVILGGMEFAIWGI